VESTFCEFIFSPIRGRFRNDPRSSAQIRGQIGLAGLGQNALPALPCFFP